MNEFQLDEVFDGEDNHMYPVVNLNPKQQPAQTFGITDENDNTLVVKLASATELGEKVVNLKPADKSLQIILFGLSDKGNFSELKNGLGQDPIATISSIISIVSAAASKQRFETIMFRFPAKKMKGREKLVQRVIKRIAAKNFTQFTALEEIENVSAKHAYVVLYRKATGLESKGLPQPSEKRFTKVETKVGETLVDKDTGKEVSKAEAIALTINDNVEKKVNDKAMASKLRMSRKEVLMAQTRGRNLPVERASIKQQIRLDDYLMNPPLVSAIDKDVPEEVKTFEKVFPMNIGSSLYRSSIGGIDVNGINLGDVTKKLKFSKGTDGSYVLFSIGSYFTKGLAEAYLSTGMRDDAIGEHVFDALSKVIEIVKRSNYGKSTETLKEVATFVDSLAIMKTVDPNTKAKMINAIINDCSRSLQKTYQANYINIVNDTLDKKEAEVVRSYCGSGYKELNRYLMGLLDSAPTAKTLKMVDQMDDIFKTKGIKLPKGTTLYRGQVVDGRELKRSVEDKVFVFRNYVSTSLSPIIFGSSSFGGSGVSGTLDANATSSEEYSDQQVIDAGLDSLTKNINNTQFIFGFDISGVDKISVIVPGTNTNYPDECEVILPRGTVLKVNKVTSGDSAIEQIERREAFLLESTIMPVEQLDESYVLYDGDLFLSEGIVKPLNEGFSFSMLHESSSIQERGSELLASCVTLENVPEKMQ